MFYCSLYGTDDLHILLFSSLVHSLLKDILSKNTFHVTTSGNRDYVAVSQPATIVYFLLFDLILYVQVNNLSVMSGWVFLGRTSTKKGFLCLDQGHNAVTQVRLDPATLRYITIMKFVFMSFVMDHGFHFRILKLLQGH